MKFEFKAIGKITSSSYPGKFGTPRQPGLTPLSRAFIYLNPDVQPELSLNGLSEYSHLWVIFVFHQNASERFHAKVHPPRLAGKTMGLFATRTPHRPNPIGLSLVQIEEVTPMGIWVSGIDFIEDTPVLDIKPYLPEVETRPEARSGWTAGLSLTPIEVLWEKEHLNQIQEYEIKNAQKNIRGLIEQTLSLDPRPTIYKGYEGVPSGGREDVSAPAAAPYREVHAVRIYNLDVHFKFETPHQIRILKILKFERDRNPQGR